MKKAIKDLKRGDVVGGKTVQTVVPIGWGFTRVWFEESDKPWQQPGETSVSVEAANP